MKKIKRFIILVGFIFLLIPIDIFTCTSFAFKHQDYLIFGTNYDNSFAPGLIYVNKKNVQKSGWEPSTTGKYATWVSKYGSVTFCVGGYQIAWAGMNEAGLVISTMALNETKNPMPDERPPVMAGLWMQYILDTCSTVEEVIETNEQIRITDAGDHHLVCDRKGGCATIEFLDGKMVCHTKTNLPVKVLTNKLYSMCADHWKQKAPLTTKPYDSINRFVRVNDMIVSFQPKSNRSAIDYAFKILKKVAYPDEQITRWSIVFDTKNFKIYFRSFNNQKIRWIDFKKLDFNCHTPVKMLYVHKDLSGEVSNSFVDYSHDITLEHVITAAKHFRPDISEEFIKKILHVVENFPCKSVSKGDQQK